MDNIYTLFFFLSLISLLIYLKYENKLINEVKPELKEGTVNKVVQSKLRNLSMEFLGDY